MWNRLRNSIGQPDFTTPETECLLPWAQRSQSPDQQD